MSLTAHIAEQIQPRVKCRTCAILAQMSDEDQADFGSAAGTYPASVIARAITAELAEQGKADAVSESSVRKHIREGHGS